jgi:hypothetical protein
VADYLAPAGLVILGTALSLVATWVVESRRLKAELSRDTAKDARQLRLAARPVRNELRLSEDEVAIALETLKWWTREVTLPTREWEAHRATLADAGSRTARPGLSSPTLTCSFTTSISGGRDEHPGATRDREGLP